MEPGQFMYSIGGFTVAGAMLEAATNKTFEQLMTEVGKSLVHSCTIFLCCLDGEIYERYMNDDPYRNPNMDNKDHRVG